MSSDDGPPQHAGTARRRPTHRKGRATLTRESVGRAALEFLSRRGPAELTMRSLAADLGVSPRALYNYVEDRRDLITLAAELFESDWHPPVLSAAPDRWRESLRAFCRDLRAHYRRHPGMTTLALSENITMARHPVMLRNVDALIGFFVGVGLPLEDAYHACMETIRQVVGFVALHDALHDRPPAHLDRTDLEGPRPSWLHAEPDEGGAQGARTDPGAAPAADREADPPAGQEAVPVTGPELPYLNRLGALKSPSPDARFEFSLTLLTEGIAAYEAQSRA